MATRQTNAIANERPDPRDHSATNRDHLQRTSGAMTKSQNAKRRFKGLICATNNHQTEMHDRAADEESDDNEQRYQNNKHNGANPHPSHRGERVVTIGEKADGLQAQREQK